MLPIDPKVEGSFPHLSPLVDRLIELALEEDVGPGDVTTQALIAPERTGSAQIRAKESLVVAGLPVAQKVFQKLDPRVQFAAPISANLNHNCHSERSEAE
jgi:nicotinate-nucleotide pyrophosphorylase